MSEHNDTVRQINESADKIVLKTSVKRGNGTRDQDKIKIKVKGDDPEEAAETVAQAIQALKNEGVAHSLRRTQPEDQS